MGFDGGKEEEVHGAPKESLDTAGVTVREKNIVLARVRLGKWGLTHVGLERIIPSSNWLVSTLIIGRAAVLPFFS